MRKISVLDFHPVNENVVATSGAEPSLRDLVFSYYAESIGDEEEACKLARDYCLQIEAFASTSEKAIQDALRTAEVGEALIEVARNAHLAEMELAHLKMLLEDQNRNKVWEEHEQRGRERAKVEGRLR